jgi:hypothetical protein
MFFYGNLCYYYFFYMSALWQEGRKIQIMIFALLCVCFNRLSYLLGTLEQYLLF